MLLLKDEGELNYHYSYLREIMLIISCGALIFIPHVVVIVLC